MGVNVVFIGSSKYLIFSRSFIIMLQRRDSITSEENLITFRGIKSRLVAFLEFLSLRQNLRIETTQNKKGTQGTY